MFSIVNANAANKNTSIRVSYKEHTVEFTISSVLSTKGKLRLDDADIFVILNAYLDYKGDKYKEELIKTLDKSRKIIEDTLFMPGVDNIPYKAIDILIDMLDLEDIYKYIKNVYKLPVPSNLKDDFDDQIEKDAKGSRDQTYTKDDYLYLAALINIFKVTIGPICLYGNIKQNDINPGIRDYFLFHFYKNNDKISSYPPMVKLCRFTEQIIKQSDEGETGDRMIVAEKSIPIEELPTYMTGILVIQRLSISPLTNDTADKNVVNTSYNYLNSKMKSPSSTSKTIRDKEPMTDIDSASGDKESIAESLRIHGELAPGMAIEMDWAVNSVDKILHQLPEEFKAVINPEVLKDATIFTKEFQNAHIEKCNIDLLAFIFKSILDPRSLDYIRLESIINLIAVGFSYLWGLGYKNIALLLVSTDMTKDLSEEQKTDIFNINTTANKPRISKELKDQIDAMYPYRRVLNKENSENVAEKAIGELVREYESCMWRTLAYEKYSVEGPLIPIDLRLQFLEFLIAHERITYVRG